MRLLCSNAVIMYIVCTLKMVCTIHIVHDRVCEYRKLNENLLYVFFFWGMEEKHSSTITCIKGKKDSTILEDNLLYQYTCVNPCFGFEKWSGKNTILQEMKSGNWKSIKQMGWNKHTNIKFKGIKSPSDFLLLSLTECRYYCNIQFG